MADAPTTALEVLRFQARQCEQAGSVLYARILRGAADDLQAGGVTARLLGGRDDDPFGSALALRFLGAVHRIVLEQRAPALARHYPSAGGDASAGDPVPDFLAALATHEVEVARRLMDGVQTNEVGRSAALVGGHAAVLARTGLPLRVLEIGASAGLNLRFDHYAYDLGDRLAGAAGSPVRFAGVWEGPPPELPEDFRVVERRGCDPRPIDPTTEEGRLTLLSFTWPDQLDRLERLHAALRVAARVPVEVDPVDAVTWVEGQLGEPRPGVATVVVHSIVLQYLSPDRRRRFRAALERAGRHATPAAPLAWLRMEPAGDLAEIRLTMWPGGSDERLGSAGYHGRPIWWGA